MPLLETIFFNGVCRPLHSYMYSWIQDSAQYVILDKWKFHPGCTLAVHISLNSSSCNWKYLWLCKHERGTNTPPLPIWRLLKQIVVHSRYMLHACLTCILNTQIINSSSVLPVKFKCQVLAHYKCSPSFGTIDKGKSTTISVSFRPQQLGVLNFQLLIHFWGPEAILLK